MISINENLFSYVNIAILLFLGLFFFIGYKRGLVRSVVSVVFSIASLYIAWLLASVLAKRFPLWPVNLYALHGTGFEEAAKELMNQFAWFILLTILIKLFFMFIVYILKGVKKIPVVKDFDALGGGVFGILEAFFWIFFLCILLNTRLFSNGADVIENTLLKPINGITSALVSNVSKNINGVEGMSTLLQGGNNLAQEQKENLEKWLDENGYGEAANSLDN